MNYLGQRLESHMFCVVLALSVTGVFLFSTYCLYYLFGGFICCLRCAGYGGRCCELVAYLLL